MPVAAKSKYDIYSAYKHEYVTPKRPVLIAMSPARYLTIEGRGEPGGEAFLASISALYNMAFTMKMAKKAAGEDYTVSKLEGFWPKSNVGLARDEWAWTIAIRTPDFVTAADRAAALAQLKKKGRTGLFDRVKLKSVREGSCVQMLHVGPYCDEERTVRQMLEFAEANRKKPLDRHHEIYLNDPRRIPPERLRTILRLPVR